ncbi:MAG: B12-binding domain-containing radical SAM protein [Steroidobacteraceae bacterium]
MAKKINIGLVQANNGFSGKSYMPYAIACLQSYISASLPADKCGFLPLQYKRGPIKELVSRLDSADIIGFSAYVWNIEFSLEAAQRLKLLRPERLIVFGGPQVPDDATSFLKRHRCIDVVVHGEGERNFLKLISAFPANEWVDIEGISYIAQTDEFITTPPAKRLRDLSEIPSPFLDGVLDELLRRHPDENWIGQWETNRGCPFQCTFCDWGSATGSKVARFEMDRIMKEIDWFSRNKVSDIFLCDANFGLLPRDIDIARHLSEARKNRGYPEKIFVQSTKNATDRAYDCQKILSEAALNGGVALSMQSLDEVTLRNIKRDNISLDSYFELATRFAKDNIRTYSDLILGLPGETYESFVHGIEKLLSMGPANRIKIGILTILPNSEMGNAAYRQRFGLITVRSKLLNMHGDDRRLDDDVDEYQELVIATDAMPRAAWRQARMFAWTTSLLYNSRLFYLPLMIAHHVGGLPYKNLIEAFMDADATHPILSEISAFFERKAALTQDGRDEYEFSEKWFDISWPVDEISTIELFDRGDVDRFYAEATDIVMTVSGKAPDFVLRAIAEASRLNFELIEKPYERTNKVVRQNLNIVEFCDGVSIGAPVALNECGRELAIESKSTGIYGIEAWCREAVWPGRLLCNCKAL